MRFKSRTRALVGSALAASIGLAGLALAAPPASAEPADIVRVAGATRYGTAADAATDAYPDGSANVVLASGERFPDALAGGGLAGSLDAPILLTTSATLSPEATAALEELDAENVTILGGTDAVSPAVAQALTTAGYTVDRVAGVNRYETAAEIADELGGTTAVLANGTNFPDALAISPGAHALELPVLLTTANSLHPAAAAQLEDKDTVIIVGGTAVVSQGIEDALEADGKDVVRLAGVNRYETSVEIAEFHTTVGFDLDEIVLATGERFPDALAGGPLASSLNAPMVLTPTNSLHPAVQSFIEDNAEEIDTIVVLGGTAAISDAVAAAAAAAADAEGETPGTGVGVTDRPELVSAQIVSTRNATQVQPGPFGGVGTVVRYTFDEPVTGAAPDVSRFKVYAFDAPNTAITGQEISVDPANNRAVLVRFQNFDNSTAAQQASRLTVATVAFDAVRDGNGLANPEGDAAIGTGTTAQLQAGVTAAPDLVSVGNFRTAATAGQTAVDFTFDQAAFTQNTTGFDLVRTNNTLVGCTAPGPGNTTAGGGTIPGGSGTTTITVICNDQLPLLTDANVARGIVAQGTVRAGATSGALNPLQAADFGSTTNTVAPDLDSAIYLPDAQPNVDTVAFVFDQPVASFIGAAPTATTGFAIYRADGTQVQSLAAQRSPENDRIVAVVFADGTLTNAVGSNVAPGTVTGATGGANQADEVATTPTTPTTTTPGRTAGPDLIAVASQAYTDGFGSQQTRVTYTFDSRIADASALRATANAGSFFAYTPDGIRLQCAQVEPQVADDRTNNQTVVCNQFNVVGGGQATNAQVRAAVLGTVAQGAVQDTNAAPRSNPEGAEVISR